MHRYLRWGATYLSIWTLPVDSGLSAVLRSLELNRWSTAFEGASAAFVERVVTHL